MATATVAAFTTVTQLFPDALMRMTVMVVMAVVTEVLMLVTGGCVTVVVALVQA